MPKPKIKKEGEEIKIKSGSSSLGEFVKRTLPKEEEAEMFEKYAEGEAKDGDIEDSLSEIYQDGMGGMVDVKRLDIKRKRGPIFRFFTFLFTTALLGALSYIIFMAYESRNPTVGGVNFSIQGNEKMAAGEEFFYTVDYKNLGDVGISNIEIKLNYPENFIFLDASPTATAENNLWKIQAIETRGGGQIKIKGKIIGEENKRNIIAGVMSYVPNNFSSEFKKETAFENAITIAGPEINIEAEGSVLLNQENEIKIKYKTRGNNYLKNFRVSLTAPDNVKIIRAKGEEGELNHWQVNEISDEEKELAIKFKAIEKINPSEELVLAFEYSEDKEHYYKFFEKKLNFEIVKNDLNLSLIVNGARSNQGADFGQTLNYSIVYENKGEVNMENVIIMAVLKSDILDWNSLLDKQNGKKGEGSLSWSKEEISELESLAPGGKGVIDFSINLVPSENAGIEPGKKYEVESYAQFSIANKEFKDSEDTKSNTLMIKINSDLSLNEQVRYFSDDNIAVGSGPLPPKVGETTSYKVYWTLTNNLHELNNAKVEVQLSHYVSFDDKSRATVGSLSYDGGTRRVIWNIGRMPISVYKAEAEFNITIIPSENDVDKILVLIPGSSVEATDVETNEIIFKQGKAKTTKLEDDNIAETDGRVVK